jgi:hypothetical protein
VDGTITIDDEEVDSVDMQNTQTVVRIRKVDINDDLLAGATLQILDEDGEIVTYKGEVLRDDAGNIIYEEREMIDREFMDALYDASGLPRDKELRKYYNATQIPYNPDGRDRDKLGKFNTVADLINKDWQFPWYEPTRPGGAYLVDTAPVNTMCLARTYDTY